MISIRDGAISRFFRFQIPTLALSSSLLLASISASALTVSSVKEQRHGDRHVLAVQFDEALVADQAFEKRMKVVNSSTGEAQTGAWQLQKHNTQLIFTNVEPDTEYWVQVSHGLKAQSGDSLNSGNSYTVKTQSLPPSVVFEQSRGYFVAGQPKQLKVSSVNVGEVDIDYFRLQPRHLSGFLREVMTSNSLGNWTLERAFNEEDAVYSGRYTLNQQRNQFVKNAISLDGVAAFEQPGIYLGLMRGKGDFSYYYQVSWFSVSDIAMAVREYPNHYQVLLSSFSTGKPYRDAELVWYGDNGVVVDRQQPDEQGMVKITNKASVKWLMASDATQTSMMSMADAQLDLSDRNITGESHQPAKLFMYSARDLYRPGETLTLNGLWRDADGKTIPDLLLKARVIAADGSEFQRFDWSASQRGFYQQQIKLSREGDAVPTGNWQVIVTSALGSEHRYSFHVEDFVPERIALTVQPKPQTNPEQALLALQADYLYGAPAADNPYRVNYQVVTAKQPFSQLPGVYFGDVQQNFNKLAMPFSEGKLDANGHAELAVRAPWQQQNTSNSPLWLKVEASVAEASGKPVVRNKAILLWQGGAKLGVRPHFKGNAQSDSEVLFDVLFVDSEGNSQVVPAATAKLVREDRDYYWRYDDSRGWYYEYTESQYPIAEQSLTENGERKQTLAFNVEWGYYRLELNYGTAVTSYRFFAGYNWYEQQNQAAASNLGPRPDAVDIRFDKPSYQAGDVAKLTLTAPQAGEVLVAVESDQLLWSKRLTMSGTSMTIDLPVASDWQRHDLYVTAVHTVAPLKVTSQNQLRSVGIAHLALDRQARVLPVSIESESKWLPQRQQTVKVKVGEVQGQGYVTLAAVDEGILSLTDYATPNPEHSMFAKERYQAAMRDLYQAVILGNGAKLAAQRFGGDADVNKGGQKPEAEVSIVSLFSGPVAIDNQGYATITLDIPDFDGQLRVMALAFTETQFGHAELAVKVANPIVSQWSLPRFIATGDQSQLSLELHNLTEQPQQVQIALDSHGLSFAPDVVKSLASLTLAPGQKLRRYLPFTAGNQPMTASVNIQLQADSGYTASKSMELAVRLAQPLVSMQRQFVVEPGQSLALPNDLFKAFSPDYLTPLLRVDNTPDLNVAEQVTSLFHYPYGCLEQSVSSTYPWLYLNEQTAARWHIAADLVSTRNEALQAGVERVLAKQLRTGAFSLWDNTGPESFWLTAYAADFLLDAREQGANIAQQPLDAALARLQQYVLRPSVISSMDYYYQSQNYQLAVQSYAAYVLSRKGNVRLESLDTIAQQLPNSQSLLPYVHLAVAYGNLGEVASAQELLAKAMLIKRGNHYYGDYGSELRDDAVAYRILQKMAMTGAQRNALLTRVVDGVRNEHWLSTQERNAVFMAAVARSGNPGSVQGELQQPEQAAVTINHPAPYQSARAAGDFTGLVVKAAKDSLYVTVSAEGFYLPSAAKAASHGLSLSRQFYVDGQAVTAEQLSTVPLKAGQTVLVAVNVQSDQRRPDLLLEDRLPAGLEIENQNLTQSAKLQQQTLAGKSFAEVIVSKPVATIIHQEFRDDRYMAAFNGERGDNYLYYLLRVVTPGVYQWPVSYSEDMYQPQFRAFSDDSVQVQVVSAN